MHTLGVYSLPPVASHSTLDSTRLREQCDTLPLPLRSPGCPHSITLCFFIRRVLVPIGLFDRNFDCVCVCLHSPYRIRLVRASPARIFSRSVHAVPFAVFSYAQPLVYSYKCARDAASHCARSPFIRAFSWPAAFRPAFPHLQHLLSPLSLSLSLSRWPNVGFICALWSPGTRLPTTLLRSISYHLSISKLI